MISFLPLYAAVMLVVPPPAEDPRVLLGQSAATWGLALSSSDTNPEGLIRVTASPVAQTYSGDWSISFANHSAKAFVYVTPQNPYGEGHVSGVFSVSIENFSSETADVFILSVSTGATGEVSPNTTDNVSVNSASHLFSASSSGQAGGSTGYTSYSNPDSVTQTLATVVVPAGQGVTFNDGTFSCNAAGGY